MKNAKIRLDHLMGFQHGNAHRKRESMHALREPATKQIKSFIGIYKINILFNR